jgi:hypothetical protein
MSLIKAFDDSMAADKTSNQGGKTGPDNPAYLGYVEFALSANLYPARNNSEVEITGPGGAEDAGDVNQGTNMPSFSWQKDLVDPETGASIGKGPTS